MDDYFKKQWKKIERTQRVISVKNLVRELSFISDKNPDEPVKMANRFFKNQEDALFVNNNQIIDKKTLADKIISNADELNKILRNEYFIMNIDRTLLLSYLSEANINIADPPCGERGRGIKRQVSFPPGLFKLFYLSCTRWAKITDSDTKKAGFIWRYLNDTGTPSTVYDIYFNLCGALLDLSINEINKILHGYANFVQIYSGYWTTKVDKNDINKRIQIINILYRHLHGQHLYNLLKIYTEKLLKRQKFILIDDILEDLKFINIHATKSKVEELLADLGLVELIPNRWTRKKHGVTINKFNLTGLWNDTCRNIENIIKNRRNIKIFTDRIIENETLNQVGKKIGVTRERVRQIEKNLRNKMTHIVNSKALRPFYDWFRNKLKIEKIVNLNKIGIKKQEFKVFDIVTQRYFNNEEMYRMDNIVIYRPEYERLSKAIKDLELNGNIINLEQIPLPGGLTDKIKLYDRIFTEKMNMVKLGGRQYFYSGRKPTKEEEIFVIIYKSGRPLHSTEVHEQAKKFNLPLNTEEGRNTLATMQRSNLLECVAPGTYAPKEWGIPKRIYITDLIYKVLKDADRPMYYDEIYAEVRANRIDRVKRTSVHYYLTSHEEVMRVYTKQYILKEWIDEPEKLVKHGIDTGKMEEGDLLYDNRVILGVFERNGSYITKYRLSEASLRASTLRISRHVELNLDSHIVVIDRYNNFHFHSCGYEAISGITRWKYISAGDVFYIEFINERVARLFTTEDFNEYVPIDKTLLTEAEEFWDREIKKWREQESEDEREADKIETVDDLISFGLEKGYVYFGTIERLADKGNNHWKILHELENREIAINY